MKTLRQRALDFRESGRFADAAMVWRSLLRDQPDDWRTALELKSDLASDFHYSESDPLFRRAARALPDREWLAHYADLTTFYTADLPFLEARAKAMLAKRPTDPDVRIMLGNVLLQQRRWAAAERHFAAMPETPDIAMKQALAGLYRRLSSAPRPDTVAEAIPYEIAVLNLDSNVSRWRDIQRAFRRSQPPIVRISAVRGSLLPAAAAHLLAGDPGAMARGTLGCFLSHAAAWEAMLARGLPHCLVIEDDVVPQLPLPSTLDALCPPEGYDLCFVNDRMQPRWPVDRIAMSGGFTHVPLQEAFATFSPDDNAPGADGYLVSAAGARKLLAWVKRDGFAYDVDWRLLAYGLTDAECAGQPRGSHAWRELDRLRHMVGAPDRLRTYVLHPALIRTVPISSDREDENRKLESLGAG